MTLEQDFDTVRIQLLATAVPDGPTHAALERIHTALVDHQRFLAELRAERDDLFGRFTKADEDRLAARAEVERWRAALETIQELAATESLRVFHTIATDALAKEDA